MYFVQNPGELKYLKTFIIFAFKEIYYFQEKWNTFCLKLEVYFYLVFIKFLLFFLFDYFLMIPDIMLKVDFEQFKGNCAEKIENSWFIFCIFNPQIWRFSQDL